MKSINNACKPLLCLLLCLLLLNAACTSADVKPGVPAENSKQPAESTAAPTEEYPEPTEVFNTRVPAVMIDGVLYVLSDKPYDGEIPEEPFDGMISSAVALSELPHENDTANLDSLVGGSYAKTEDGVLLMMDGAWTLFVPDEG